MLASRQQGKHDVGWLELSSVEYAAGMLTLLRDVSMAHTHATQASCIEIDMAHRKTCRRWNDAGHAHFLTFSCFGRRPFLCRDRTRLWMLDAIERTRMRHGFHLWAYVLMPEHVHLLIWPVEPTYSISAILKTFKQSTARRALTFVRQNAPAYLTQMEDRQPNGKVAHRFWQRGGGFDRNLTEPASVWQAVDYMHANPVRRRLCERPIDWRWSSAREMEQPGSGDLRLDLESFPRTVDG